MAKLGLHRRPSKLQATFRPLHKALNGVEALEDRRLLTAVGHFVREDAIEDFPDVYAYADAGAYGHQDGAIGPDDDGNADTDNSLETEDPDEQVAHVGVAPTAVIEVGTATGVGHSLAEIVTAIDDTVVVPAVSQAAAQITSASAVVPQIGPSAAETWTHVETRTALRGDFRFVDTTEADQQFVGTIHILAAGIGTASGNGARWGVGGTMNAVILRNGVPIASISATGGVGGESPQLGLENINPGWHVTGVVNGLDPIDMTVSGINLFITFTAPCNANDVFTFGSWTANENAPDTDIFATTATLTNTAAAATSNYAEAINMFGYATPLGQAPPVGVFPGGGGGGGAGGGGGLKVIAPGDINKDGVINELDDELWLQMQIQVADGETPYLMVSTEDDIDNGEYGIGDLSLREALDLAAANPGEDLIVFAPWVHSVTLDGTQLAIDSDVTIAGRGADKLSIDADGLSRVFSIDAGVDATISGMTITGGSVTASSPGGNVGGGILNQGDLELNSVVVVGNQTDYTNLSGTNGGGGIQSVGGDLRIIDSTIDGNRARYGGGVGVGVNAGKALEISGSTISNNFALSSSNDGGGGGIHLNGATTASLVMTNVTFSGNRSKNAAAIYVGSATTNLTVVNATIADNHTKDAAGSYISGGIVAGIGNHLAGTVTLHNTILADNVASNPAWHNGMGSLAGTGSSHNLIDIDYSGIGISHSPTTTGNKVGSGSRLATLLAPLGDYGGKTKTHALKVGSPALDAGKGSLTDTLDQRGYVREYDLTTTNGIDGYRDIGAYEASTGTTLIVRSDGDRNDSVALKATTDSLRLREALALSAALAGTETISFDQSGWVDDEIQLSSTWGELLLSSGASIVGPGADQLSIKAAPSNRVFYISAGEPVSLSGMRITGGDASGVGGGISTSSWSTTIDRVQIDDNSTSGAGGGISVAAYGGLTLKNSTLADNSSNYDGGGIYAASNSVVTILNSTISGNESQAHTGGGVYTAYGSTLRVVNSTIAYNSASYGSAGIVASGTARLDNSIVAHNTTSASYGSPDISGTFSSSSINNLIGFDSVTGNGIDDGEDDNLVGGEGSDPELDARLTALGNYGGPTLTHALKYNSPAIDAGDDSIPTGFDLEFDQRGFDRSFDWGIDEGVDIGAIELALDEYYM